MQILQSGISTVLLTREFAAKEKLEIVASFQEAKTAKEPVEKYRLELHFNFGKRKFLIIKSKKLLTNKFMNMNQKGFASIIWVLIIVVLAGVIGYFALVKKSPPVSTNNSPITSAPTKIVPPNKILKVSIGLISKQFSPDFYPKVSADGSKIVFWKSGRENVEEKGLWVMNADGTGIKQLIKDDVVGNNFEWSPIVDTHYNERYVFYIARKEISNQTKFPKTTYVLKVVNQDGDYTKELTTNDEDVAFPRWISITDIAYIDRNQNNQLKIIDIGGRRPARQGNEIALVYGEYRNNALDQGVIKSVTFNGIVKQLTPDNENGAFPVLSPDGKKVAYISFWSGPQKIIVMNIDGSNKVQVGSGDNPSWSFDSSRIAYNLAKEDQYNVAASDIYVVNASGSGNKKVETEIEKGPALNPRWFPDGKHIVLDYSDKGVGTIEIVPVE